MHHCTGHGCRAPEGAACAAASARQLPAASGQLEVLWAQRPACAAQGRRRARRPTSMLAPGSRCEPSAGTAPGWPAAAASPPCGVCCASGCGRAIPARRPSVTRPIHGHLRAWSVGSVRWTPCGCPQHDDRPGRPHGQPAAAASALRAERLAKRCARVLSHQERPSLRSTATGAVLAHRLHPLRHCPCTIRTPSPTPTATSLSAPTWQHAAACAASASPNPAPQAARGRAVRLEVVDDVADGLVLGRTRSAAAGRRAGRRADLHLVQLALRIHFGRLRARRRRLQLLRTSRGEAQARAPQLGYVNCGSAWAGEVLALSQHARRTAAQRAPLALAAESRAPRCRAVRLRRLRWYCPPRLA